MSEQENQEVNQKGQATFEQLRINVLMWARTKGIISSTKAPTPEVFKGQLKKMREECGEMCDAIDAYLNAEFSHENLEEVIDGFGDALVTIIINSFLLGIHPNDALQHAYDIIIRRNGKMVDGAFVKESVTEQPDEQ